MRSISIGDKKVLFIHIPKTGGTSITVSINSLCETKIIENNKLHLGSHAIFSDLVDLGFNKDDFDYIFAVVRNPYTRMESKYFYDMRNYSYKPWLEANPNSIMPKFSEWIINGLNTYSKHRKHSSSHFIPQHEFLNDPIVGIDVFKFEEGVDTILQKVSEKFGIILPLEHRLNTTKFPIEWTSDCIDAVNKVYETDFIKFNYDMNKKP